jgi:hypothetical protein
MNTDIKVSHFANVSFFHKCLQKDMKLSIVLENYEWCQVLKRYIADTDSFYLGTCPYNSIYNDLFRYCKVKAKLIQLVEIEKMLFRADFLLYERNFAFLVNEEEAIELELKNFKHTKQL